MPHTRPLRHAMAVALTLVLWSESSASQNPSAPAASGGVAVAREFTIGPEDVLTVVVWREKELSADVTVRPDGIVSLPLLGDLPAVGKTPTVLASEIQTAAGRYLTDPNVTVVVRQINSRKVFVTGEVKSPGSYPLISARTVMQQIAMSGGLLSFAQRDKITILRSNGQDSPRTFRFNYGDVARGRNLDQNIELEPGDTIVVP